MEKQAEIAKRLAQALNTFRDQHGDERFWGAYEWSAHDRLVEKIKKNEGP